MKSRWLEGGQHDHGREALLGDLGGASIPSRTGILMSMITRSGIRDSVSSTAIWPFCASPTTSYPLP